MERRREAGWRGDERERPSLKTATQSLSCATTNHQFMYICTYPQVVHRHPHSSYKHAHRSYTDTPTAHTQTNPQFIHRHTHTHSSYANTPTAHTQTHPHPQLIRQHTHSSYTDTPTASLVVSVMLTTAVPGEPTRYDPSLESTMTTLNCSIPSSSRSS